MDGDLELPGGLLRAARSLATAHKEVVLMATGPDSTSVAMTKNALVSLQSVGLRRNVLVLADSWKTCAELLDPPCFWSSRVLRKPPSESIVMTKFWDWRFKFYFVKKHYIASLVRGGFSVLQADTDTVWSHDPFPVLRSMAGSSIITMKDVGLANAGVVYARPGSAAGQALLDDVAYRVQLLQNWPEIVPTIVPWARPPYYANSDDQTLLNDAIVSAVIRNRTFLGSTAQFEAKNRYNPTAPPWDEKERALYSRQLGMMRRRSSGRHVTLPWDPTAVSVRYSVYDIGENDTIAMAPRALFAHLPYSPHNAVTHLTAARGFSSKVKALTKIGKWDPEGTGRASVAATGSDPLPAKMTARLPVPREFAGKAAAKGGGGKAAGKAKGGGGKAAGKAKGGGSVRAFGGKAGGAGGGFRGGGQSRSKGGHVRAES